MLTTRALSVAGVIVVCAAWCLAQVVGAPRIKHALATKAVGRDADDPAIWVSRRSPGKSLILGTDKAEGPDGALYAFDVKGNIVQRFGGLNRPNNVDVELDVRLGGRTLDVAVLTERRSQRLRVFSVQAKEPFLTDISGSTPVFGGSDGDSSEPMGIGLYRRPRDGALFAIVSRKTGPLEGYLGQYRLTMTAGGRVDAREVRKFGKWSGTKEIEAVAVDDALGYVYYADERVGIRKYQADPDVANAGRELALFATAGYEGDREGIAFRATGKGTGYIVSVDQRKGNSVAFLYRREGEPGRPHDHRRIVARWSTGADETDGVDVVALAVGPRFPRGLMVSMNSKGRNFFLYPWPKSIARP